MSRHSSSTTPTGPQIYTMLVQGAHVMQFARAIGEDADDFYDADRIAGTGLHGLVAPPTFLMAADHFDPNFARRPQPGRPWIGSAHFEQVESVGFHTEQHFTFHRPVRAGDRLTVTTRPGATWHKHGRRAGAMTFTETLIDYRDEAGELAVESRWVQASAERRPESDPRPEAAPVPIDLEPAGPPPRGLTRSAAHGQSWSLPLIDEVTRTTIVMYAGASGDFAPLHCDESVARKKGYPGVFAHGMLTMGMSARAVTAVIAHDRVRYFGGRITGQVWPGDALTAYAQVISIDDDAPQPTATIAVTTNNQLGRTVFAGEARVLLET